MNRFQKQNENIEKLTNLGYWEWWPETNKVMFSSGFIKNFSFLKNTITPENLIQYLKRHLSKSDFVEFSSFLKDLKYNRKHKTQTFAFPISEEYKFFELNAFRTEEDGNSYIAGTIQEVTEKVKYQKLKEKELLFEKRIASIASKFLNEENFEHAIKETLQDLGQLCTAQRVGLLKIENNNLTQEYEWVANNQQQGYLYDSDIPSVEIKLFIDLLKEKKHIFYQSIAELPDRLVEIKAKAKKLGIDSLAVSSIQKDNRTIGALFLAKSNLNIKWDFSDIHMAKMTSIILSNALKQNNLNKTLTESEKRLKFALLAGNLGTYELNLPVNNRYFDERSANIFGYSNHTINKLDNWFEKNLHPDFIEEYEHCISLCLEGDKNYYELEYKIECRDGSFKWVNDWGIVTDTNSEGEPNKIVGIIQDISQRKNIEKALIFAKEKAEENENLKTAFLANVSHEIRTPMNGISGFAELLYHNMVSDNDKHRYLEIIYKNSNRLLTLINNILDISKLETNQLHIYENPCTIKSIVDDVVTSLSSKIEHNKFIEFSIETEKKLSDLVFIADDARLKQVLTNILENALKFTNQGYIKAKIELNDVDEIIFTIEDTGRGISKEFQKKIFNRFSQSDFTIKQNFGGSGLGLPISKGLVESMGGSIWVKSLKGVGSTFCFSIPLKLAEAAAKP